MGTYTVYVQLRLSAVRRFSTWNDVVMKLFKIDCIYVFCPQCPGMVFTQVGAAVPYAGLIL